MSSFTTVSSTESGIIATSHLTIRFTIKTASDTMTVERLYNYLVLELAWLTDSADYVYGTSFTDQSFYENRLTIDDVLYLMTLDFRPHSFDQFGPSLTQVRADLKAIFDQIITVATAQVPLTQAESPHLQPSDAHYSSIDCCDHYHPGSHRS